MKEANEAPPWLRVGCRPEIREVLAGHISNSAKRDQKGKELDLWALACRLAGGWGRRGTLDFSLPFPGAGASPLPARVRDTTTPSLSSLESPLPAATLILGSGAWRKRSGAPKGSPPTSRSSPSAALPSPARTLGLPPAWDLYGHVAWDRERGPAAARWGHVPEPCVDRRS